MEKKWGRPPVGVPKDTVSSYVDCLEGWIHKRILPRWLKDVDHDAQAIEAYEQLDLLARDTHEHLTLWCQTWLTDEGWRRLQANARQKRYKHREQETGPKFKRISLNREIAIDLEHYAKRRGITLNEAIERLLKTVTQ